MRTVAFVIVPLLFPALAADAAERLAAERIVSDFDNQEYLPQVAYNSVRDEWLVVWHDFNPPFPGSAFRNILGRRVDRFGTPIGGNAVMVISSFTDDQDRAKPAVAYDPSNDRYLVVYLYDFFGDGSDWDVRGRFWQGDGGPASSEFVIEATGSNEWDPQVAFSTLSNKYLVTWWTQASTGNTVDGALFGFGQAPLSLNIATHSTQQRFDPDVAYQPFGDNFLVVYSNGLDIFAKTVEANGTIRGEIDIAASADAESSPSVASCANFQYLVSWHSLVAPNNNEVFVRFLRGDGSINSQPILISGTSLDEQNSDLSCTHGDIDYLIAFEQQFGNPSGPFGISGRRIRANKVLRPEFDIRPVLFGETGLASRPALAGGPLGWLVAWEHDRQSSTYQDIHGRVVWANVIFADGFESGGTSAWSSASP